jgi:hypothetical protein
MRTLLTAILTCFISIANIAQDNTTIKLVPKWKKGEIKKYEIKNYSIIDAEGERKINGLTTKTISIEIVDVNDKILELAWKVDQLIFSDTTKSDDPFSGLMNTLDKDLSVRYTINRNGNVIRILNLDEISKTIKSRIDTVLKDFIKKNDIEKSKAEMLNFQFSMMFSTDEQIKTIVLSDILKFHQIYGYSFMTNRTTVIPDNIFAPNENDRPSNSLELKCSNVDKLNQIYSIEGELKSSETNKKMQEFIDKDRIIKNKYEFKFPENWLKSHKSIMNVDAGGVKANTTYDINLVE